MLGGANLFFASPPARTASLPQMNPLKNICNKSASYAKKNLSHKQAKGCRIY
jgi:hypothetical protein